VALFVFWLSLSVIVFTYLGYPLLLAGWAGVRRRPVRKADWLPNVSIVMAVYNGEKHLEAKLSNLLSLDYPANLYEIVMVSDGSTDGTLRIARAVRDPRLRVFELPARGGKPSALNLAVEEAHGEIIVFNDVRQTMAPDAVKRLVANLADGKVGAVTGELLLANENLRPQLGLYYRYEQWMRLKESEIHSMIGSAGAFSAIRRSLFAPLPAGLILDDVYTPMQILMRGYRTVFEPEAKAFDPHDDRPEFRRKIRTLAGNYQLLYLIPEILTLRNPLLFQYVCHKIARLAGPFFLLLLLVSSAWLHRGLYAWALAGQLLFYLCALSFRQLKGLPGLGTIAASGHSFLMANCAALVGLFVFLRGKKDVWV
jgi:poly-beta-1,6-N-acetyl-D-glucosamine synthase